MKAQSLQHQLLLPLMALLLALMLGNALLMQSALNWGSEAQTRQQLVYQAQFWQARLPAYSQQIDSFTWLVLAYDDLPATVREQLSPLWRGLDELSGAQEDVFILSWPKPAGEVFYLLFNTQQIEPDEPLETQVMLRYGLLIGPAVLLGLLCLWWLIRRAVQPLKQVQQQLQMWDGHVERAKLVLPPHSSAEVRQLLQALNQAVQQVRQAVAREQQFTRFASHELRTPVAVVQAALERLQGTLPAQQPALARIARAVKDMQGLIETFLLLARERTVDGAARDAVLLDAHYLQAVQAHLAEARAMPTLHVEVEGVPGQWASGALLHVLLSNLLRNAAQHGDGSPTQVHLTSAALTVTNRLAEERSAGEGWGLQIVQAICAHCGWQFAAEHDDQTFTACVCFNPEPAEPSR